MMHEGYKFFFVIFWQCQQLTEIALYYLLLLFIVRTFFPMYNIVLSLSNSAISNKEYDRYFLFQLFELYFMYLTQKDYIQ